MYSPKYTTAYIVRYNIWFYGTRQQEINLKTKGTTIWILSTLTFFTLIHTIDAAIALIFNNQAQLPKMYPLIGEYLTQIPADLYLYISAAITIAMWGLTCIVAFNNPIETFLKETMSGAQAQVQAEEQIVEKDSDFFDLMYQTMEENKGELARTNDLVLNLRAEIKDMQKVGKAFGETNAAIVGLEKQVGMLEEKMIFPLLCKSCGKPLRADFSICPYCGLEINSRQEAVVCESSFSDKRRVNKKSKKRKNAHARKAKGCQYWFGYLSQKQEDKPIPKECEECKKVVECILNQLCSPTVIAEIKKLH
jgi:hypothetical protein